MGIRVGHSDRGLGIRQPGDPISRSRMRSTMSEGVGLFIAAYRNCERDMITQLWVAH